MIYLLNRFSFIEELVWLTGAGQAASSQQLAHRLSGILRNVVEKAQIT